ncbi:MAG: hypothetical protein SGBAC_002855 [Bacillariaceae sp.]
MVKVIIGGMVLTSAGFAMYTRRTGQMLKQMEYATKSKAKRMPPPKVGPMTQRFSKAVTSINQDDDIADEEEQQRIRAYDAFSMLARTKKSWQRLGHLVELAADHTVINSDSESIGMNSSRSIADVGTDHGLLAMSFALSGRYERVLGVDVSEQALQNGALSLLNKVNEVSEQQLKDDSNDNVIGEATIPVRFRVSDGFVSIEEGEADTICIAGMGVNTMIKILSMSSDDTATTHLDRIQCQQLLLQPTNSRPSNLIRLYECLQHSGWRLVDERIEELSKRWYVSSCFQRIEKDVDRVNPNTPTKTELPTSKLLRLEKDDPMYPAFQKYVAHHCQWIERDVKARGTVKETDEIWLKAFQKVARG